MPSCVTCGWTSVLVLVWTSSSFYTVRCALVVELTVVLILLPLLSSLFINYGDSPGSVSDTWGRQKMCYIFFLPFTMSCLCLTFNYQPWHHVCFLLFLLFKESFYVTLTRFFRGQKRLKSELYVREEKGKQLVKKKNEGIELNFDNRFRAAPHLPVYFTSAITSQPLVIVSDLLQTPYL